MSNNKTTSHLKKMYHYLATNPAKTELYAATADVGDVGIGFVRTPSQAVCFTMGDDQGVYTARDLAANLRPLIKDMKLIEVELYEEYMYLGNTDAGLSSTAVDFLKDSGLSDEQVQEVRDYIKDIGVYFQAIDVNQL